MSGASDVSVPLANGTWGAWQPYATNNSFVTNGCTSLTLAFKPTVSGQTWSCQFECAGDVPVGKPANVTDYGPAPVPGRWATYTVPLANLGVANSNIYKFAIQDQTGLADNVWYVEDVGFAP